MATLTQKDPNVPEAAAASKSSSRPKVECPKRITRWASDGTISDMFERRKALGKGGFAVVYEVLRSRDNTLWALKVCTR